MPEQSKRRVSSMYLFANGDIVAFDQHGEPIQELQMRSAIDLWAEYSAASGFDVDGCKFHTQKPGGDGPSGKIEATFDGFAQRWD